MRQERIFMDWKDGGEPTKISDLDAGFVSARLVRINQDSIAKALCLIHASISLCASSYGF